MSANPAASESTAAAEVVMYSSSWCGSCMRARNLFERKGIAFTEIKVDEDPADREAMIVRSGGRRTVPQVFIGHRHVGGFEQLYELDTAGELDRLLGRA